MSASSLEDYTLYNDCFKGWYEGNGSGGSSSFKDAKDSFKADTNGIIPYMFYKLDQQQGSVKKLKIAGGVEDISVAEKLGAGI